MMRFQSQPLFMSLLLVTIGSAWLALWVWGRSPYARYLDHSHLSAASGADLSLLVFFVAGWTLMIFAMMLPTSLPLIAIFHVMVRDRSDRLLLTALLIAGYLGAWAYFGVLAHVGDMMVHWLVSRSYWLSTNAWVVGAGTLVIAGAYQFMPWKYHCLDQCRSPLSFIIQRWKGTRYSTQALRLGIHHGIYCAGCCWSLMVVMFVVGAGSIGWMLALGAVMAAEKNLSWGRRLARPIGAILIVSGIAIVVWNSLILP